MKINEEIAFWFAVILVLLIFFLAIKSSVEQARANQMQFRASCLQHNFTFEYKQVPIDSDRCYNTSDGITIYYNPKYSHEGTFIGLSTGLN